MLIRKLRDHRLRKYFRRYDVEYSGNGYFEDLDLVKFHGFSYIGPDAYWSAKGGIEIGKNVIFGPKTVIWTYNHNFRSDKMVPYDTEIICKKVIISENVWVGLGAMLLPGVEVGEGSVVAARSVVTKNVPALSVVAGNPAKVVGKRSDQQYEAAKINQYLVRKFLK